MACPQCILHLVIFAGLDSLARFARCFGDFKVDQEAEKSGLLLRCFESRERFFWCCGSFHVRRKGMVVPPLGCFPQFDSDNRVGPAIGEHVMGPYRKAYVRCCQEPILRHRNLLRGKVAGDTWSNYTLFHVNPVTYNSDDGYIRLAGYRLSHLGAASMSEDIHRALQAMWDFKLGNQEARIAENQILYSQPVQSQMSFDGEEYMPVFEALRSSGVNMSFTFIDIGAADGAGGQSPLYEFMQIHQSKIAGVAFEGDETSCAAYKKQWPEIDVQCGKLTAEKLYESPPLDVMESVFAHRVGGEDDAHCIDVWKVDIDSIDCTVLEVLMRQAKPKLLPKAVILEVNPHFPPPYRFSVTSIAGPNDSQSLFWARTMRGLFGCSLSHQVALLKEFDYWLMGYQHKDALFVQKKFAHAFNVTAPVNEFVAYSNAIVMIGDGLTPRTMRHWFSERPHVGLGLIQDHLIHAQRQLSQHVHFSLSI